MNQLLEQKESQNIAVDNYFPGSYYLKKYIIFRSATMYKYTIKIRFDLQSNLLDMTMST